MDWRVHSCFVLVLLYSSARHQLARGGLFYQPSNCGNSIRKFNNLSITDSAPVMDTEEKVAWSPAMTQFLINYYKSNELVLLANEVVNGVDRKSAEALLVVEFNASFNANCTEALLRTKWKNIRDAVGKYKKKKAMNIEDKATRNERCLYKMCEFLHKYITQKIVSVPVDEEHEEPRRVNGDTQEIHAPEVVVVTEEISVPEVIQDIQDVDFWDEFHSYPVDHNYYSQPTLEDASTAGTSGVNDHQSCDNIEVPTVPDDAIPNDVDAYEPSTSPLLGPQNSQDEVDDDIDWDFPKKGRKRSDKSEVQAGKVDELMPQLDSELQILQKQQAEEDWAGSIHDMYETVDSSRKSIALKAILKIMKKHSL